MPKGHAQEVLASHRRMPEKRHSSSGFEMRQGSIMEDSVKGGCHLKTGLLHKVDWPKELTCCIKLIRVGT